MCDVLRILGWPSASIRPLGAAALLASGLLLAGCGQKGPLFLAPAGAPPSAAAPAPEPAPAASAVSPAVSPSR